MTEYIPFATGEESAKIIKRIYSDSAYVRVPLDRRTKIAPFLPADCKIWLDPAIDGIAVLDKRRTITRKERGQTITEENPWFTFFNKFPHANDIGLELETPDKKKIGKFVSAVLTACASHNPAMITIPQVPFIDGNARNKVNRIMAAAAGDWKSNSNFKGRLILPLVFTHQKQINSKVARNSKVGLAEKCFQESQADGVWTVDESLADDNGSGTYRDVRFPGVISFHSELNEKVLAPIKIAGPYWGLNLLLWSKGLINFPAIGVGTGFKYFLSGGRANTPDVKICLNSLRRRVTASADLKRWLQNSIERLSPENPAHQEFSSVLQRFATLSDRDHAREFVAKAYKSWIDTISSLPTGGRAMAMFQDLSVAFALGKSLDLIASEESQLRRPEAVVAPLMLNCL